MKKAAILARVSKKRQGEEDRMTLPAQFRAGRDYCASMELEVAREYEAKGESAYSADIRKRPVMQRILHDAEAGVFQVLVYHESSRFARNARFDREFRDRLTDLGIEIVDLTCPVDSRTAEGKFFQGFQAEANEYWSNKLSEHTRKGYRERFERGLPTGFIAFGYRSSGATNEPPVVVPDEAEAIAKGFEDYVAGKGYTDIMNEWNALGLRPRSLYGRTTFNLTGVQRILQNDFYAGYVRHRGERRKGAHAPIISDELWERAQTRIRRHVKRSVGGGGLLTGLAVCAACDGPIWTTSASAGRLRYYREAAPSQGRPCRDGGRVWRVDQLDRFVEDVVLSMSIGDDWLALVDREARRQPRGDSEQNRAALVAKKKRITDAYIAEALSEHDWRGRIAEVDLELARLRPETNGMLAAAGKLQSFADLWHGASPETQREACRLLFASARADMAEKHLELRPWEEFLPLFQLRREFVVGCDPRRG